MKNILALFLAFWVTVAPVLAQSGVSQNSGITIGAPKNPTVDAPPDAAYGVVTPNSSLPNARTLTGGSNISVTDGGAGGSVTFAVSGQIPVANGGTGASTQQGAANAVLNFPGLTSQDLFYYNGANIARFPKGSASTFLQTDGSGNLTWVGGTGGGISGTAPVLMFGTDPSSTASRNVTAGTGISVTDGGALGNATFAIDSTVATLTGSQTLTNKVLTAPTMAYNAGSGFNLAGSVFNSALKWADWAAARNLTIPDPGADASFVMTEGAATINGVKTFGSTPVLSTGALTVGGSTVTVPAAADTLVNLASSQSLSNKTIVSPVLNTGYALKTGSFSLNHTWDAPAADRAYTIKDVGGDAHFVMKDTTSAYTAGAIPYGDGSKLVVGSAGTSGQPLLSGGTGAYTFGTLGPTVGGTNQTTYATGDTLYASGANTLAKRTIGSTGDVLTVAGGVPTWAAPSTGTLTLNSLPFMTASSGSLTASATTGDIIYGSGSNAYSKLAIGSTGKVLKVAAGLPSWGDDAGVSLYGDGADGAKTISSNTTETVPKIFRLTTLTIQTGCTWTVKSGTLIMCTGAVDIQGTGKLVVSADIPGGTAGNASGLIRQNGSGPSPGTCSAHGIYSVPSGGGCGGPGGDGGFIAAGSMPGGKGGAAIAPAPGVTGSGGGAGYYGGSPAVCGDGGNGGGSVGLYSGSTINIAASAKITANGTAGSAQSTTYGVAGAGGSGGVIDIGALISITNSGTIEAKGGLGGNAVNSGYFAPGGGGGLVNLTAPSITAGTITLTGGAKGSGGMAHDVSPTNGSTGVTYSTSAAPVKYRCF